MKPITNIKFGALGEKFAVAYLKRKRYKILEKNYKTKLGEVDIIARDGKEIVFIEVKTRSADPYLGGKYAVNRKKQFHIMRTASVYLSNTNCTLQPRFDIIEVELDRSTQKPVNIEHYENAFCQTEAYARF